MDCDTGRILFDVEVDVVAADDTSAMVAVVDVIEGFEVEVMKLVVVVAEIDVVDENVDVDEGEGNVDKVDAVADEIFIGEGVINWQYP